MARWARPILPTARCTSKTPGRSWHSRYGTERVDRPVDDGEKGLVLLGLATDPEDVAVGMAHVHLADAPRHVGRRPGDVETLLEAVPMDGVDVVHPDRHPGTLV